MEKRGRKPLLTQFSWRVFKHGLKPRFNAFILNFFSARNFLEFQRILSQVKSFLANLRVDKNNEINKQQVSIHVWQGCHMKKSSSSVGALGSARMSWETHHLRFASHANCQVTTNNNVCMQTSVMGGQIWKVMQQQSTSSEGHDHHLLLCCSF